MEAKFCDFSTIMKKDMAKQVQSSRFQAHLEYTKLSNIVKQQESKISILEEKIENFDKDILGFIEEKISKIYNKIDHSQVDNLKLTEELLSQEIKEFQNNQNPKFTKIFQEIKNLKTSLLKFQKNEKLINPIERQEYNKENINTSNVFKKLGLIKQEKRNLSQVMGRKLSKIENFDDFQPEIPKKRLNPKAKISFGIQKVVASRRETEESNLTHDTLSYSEPTLNFDSVILAEKVFISEFNIQENWTQKKLRKNKESMKDDNLNDSSASNYSSKLLDSSISQYIEQSPPMGKFI